MSIKTSKFLILVFGILLLIPFIHALDNSTLVAYYSFDESSFTSSVIDSTGVYNLGKLGTTSAISTNGKLNSGINLVTAQAYTRNISKLDDTYAFSVNFWARINNTANLNSSQFFYYANSNTTTTSNQYGFFKLSGSAFATYIVYSSGSARTSTSHNVDVTGEYFMVTLVFINGTGIKYYLNGNYQSTSSNIDFKTFPTNMQMFILGIFQPSLQVYNTSIDELSLWNKTLIESEIQTLYNGGNGLNYNQTSGLNPVILPPFCSDANTLCSAPIYFGDGLGCYKNDTLNCAQGCSESTGVAICSNNCINECNIIGSTKCSDTTTISQCDDWNLDGCFEYRPLSTCSVGQFCINSGNFLGSCVNTTQNGVHNQYALNVIPYSTSDSNTSYILNTATRTLDVSSIFSAHTQDFYTSGTTYVSRTCDYTEPTMYSNGFINVTTTNSSTQTISSALSSDTIIKLNIRPSDYGNGTIIITDTLSTVNSKYYYERNFAQKKMCLYDSSYTVIYCDYSTNSFDDLTSLNLEYSFQFSTKTYTTKLTFNRAVSNIIIVGAQTFLGANIFNINVTAITNETNILETIVSSPTPYSTFTSNTGGTRIIQVINPNCNCGTVTCSEYKLVFGVGRFNELCLINQTIPVFVQSCVYLTNGNHLSRTYGNNNGVPDYSTYQDYNINIVGLGLTTSEVANANPNTFVSGGGLPTFWKYIIVAITIMIIFGVFLTIGMQTHTEKTTVMFATVLSVLAVIIYTIIGWISAWIIVAIIVLSLAILILLGSMKTSAGGV